MLQTKLTVTVFVVQKKVRIVKNWPFISVACSCYRKKSFPHNFQMETMDLK